MDTRRQDNTARWMVAAGLFLLVFTAMLFVPSYPEPGDEPAAEAYPTEEVWPQITRCSVVMPEDLDRVDGNAP